MVPVGAVRIAAVRRRPSHRPAPSRRGVVAEASRVGADLIAVGSHGHGAAYDLTVGSISAGVIRRSSVPVLVATSRR